MPSCQLISNNVCASGFRYLWLKHVTGFNPEYHCAKCLRGKYIDQFGLKMPANQSIPIDLPNESVVYACGVAWPYRWANNMHMAMRIKPHARCETTLYTGDKILFEGFEKIEFTDQKAKLTYPRFSASYLTCRNFQFGCHYFL